MTIWQSPDDKGRYQVEVRRVSASEGTLVLLRDGQVLRQQQVSLAYGAMFGPDVADVMEWNRIATQWSDELDASTGGPARD